MLPKNFKFRLPSIKAKNTAIVYFIYINPNKNWQQFILDQLNYIKKTKILSIADLHIVVSNPFKVVNIDLFFNTLKNLYKEIEFYEENKFEYWGIFYVWMLAQKKRNYEYIIYFHTKGMSHEDNNRSNRKDILTYYTFNNWKLLVDVFKSNSNINKIGLFPGYQIDKNGETTSSGWVWYNFWWARSKYIRILERPQIEPRNRYYYESWLSFVNQKNLTTGKDNFSIYSMSVLSYTQEETIINMEKLIKNSKNLVVK